MDAFTYREARGVRELAADGVSLAEIADAVGTPVYCYSSAALEARYQAFAAALAPAKARLCYAVKANDNLAVIRTLARLGAGADVVSEGELYAAMKAGIPPGRIVFSGVGKTVAEMAAALDAGIGQFNVESEAEMEALAHVAAARGKRAAIALRINPDIDAGTHEKIATGRKHDKFGVAYDQAPALYERARAHFSLEACGVALHIGSQLTSLAPFEAAFARAADLVERLRRDGHAISRLDLGGGLGIAYRDETPPAPDAYGALVARIEKRLGIEITVEPGRWLVGPAGLLLAQVIYTKRNGEKTFAIVDAAMNDLIRPALYGAYHRVVPVKEPAPDAPRETVDLVGPVCESGDVLALGRDLPRLEAGDLVAILDAGAYGAVMSSAYNARPPAAEVMLKDGAFAVVRPRLSHDALLARDVIPGWLA
ncbi:MAG: diaminopimelate decarboxylase [Alphaproteobacteria bacterium]